MRYQAAHAAKSGSVPFMLRGPKSAKKVLSAATAGILGLGSTMFFASPAMAAGTISVTVAPASANEGSNLVYTVNYTGGVANQVVTLAYTGTAVGGASEDYTVSPVGASLTFATGETSKQVTVATRADSLYEGGPSGTAETVILTATIDVSNNGAATGSIVDGDTAPTYSLSAAPDPVLESNATPQATITATLTKRSATDTLITVNTQDGTAKAGSDYPAVSARTLTVLANSLTGTTLVDVTKDTVNDTAATENFTVTSTSAGVIQPTSSVAGSTTVNILDAQTTPVLTLTGGGSVAEGSTLTYGLALNYGSEKEIKVDWDSVATSPVTRAATPGTDFTYPASRTVTIPARQTTGSIAVQTLKDNLDEDDETFDVQLKSPVNATLGVPSQVTGMITQGKDAPKVTIAPATAVEGTVGRTAATFTATLSAASAQTVKVNWATGPDGVAGYGKALPGTDFVTKTGTLTFAPGVTSQTFTVEIIGDTIDEGSTNGVQASTDGETFVLALTRPDGDYSIDLSDPGANRTIKILDDDSAPTLVFGDKTQKEGNDTTALLTPVTLSNGSDHDITIVVAKDASVTTGNLATEGPLNITVNGVPYTNGVGGNDYNLLNGTVTIPAEQVNAYPVLLINGDTVNEENEVINLMATPGAGSTFLATGSTVKKAVVTLENDDAVPAFEVNSITGTEGSTVAVTGTVTGQRQGYAQVAVNFAGGSSKGSVAASATDFENPGVKVVDIAYGTPNNTVIKITDLKLLTDTLTEPAETIIATGSGINNTATVTEGIITIAANTGGTTPPTTPPTDPADPDVDITLMSAASFRLGAGTLKISGVGPASKELTLWGKAVGSADSAPWENLGKATTSAAGAYFFTPEFTTTGYWFKASFGDSESDTIKVNLKEDPDFTAKSSAKGKVTLNVVGDPKVRGLSVRVLRLNDDDSWTTVGTGILNAEGSYSRTINAATGKTVTYKATVYGDGEAGLLTNTTANVRVAVK